METAFRRFGTMIDCSRNAVMNTSAVKRWIDVTAGMGYNTLMLYTEDTYEVNNQPYFGYMRGRYSQAELRELDDYAAQKGMELIPCIQTLAHLNAIFRWPVYGDIRDCDDILLAGDDKTYRLLEDIFQTLENTFRSRTINIGMDEAHMLGRGKYQDLHGFEDRSELLVKHLARVAEIAAAHGFELIMWGDMFFRLISGGAYYVDHLTVSDEVKKKIPANVNLIYWDYNSTDQQRYDKQIKAHSAIKENIWFAGGLWIWSGFAPHNRYSITATSAALAACRENGVQDVFLTMWGDDGAECAKFSVLPSLYFAAEAARGNTDMQRIKDGFRAMFGIDFDTFMLLDLPGTPNDSAQQIRNADKYALYNDCLAGLLDPILSADTAAQFAACGKQLAAVDKNTEYGYLFETMQKLCALLAVKADIGKRTRSAYRQKDAAALRALVGEYESLSALVDDFYCAFRRQWMIENKPHGFDVQDIRIGGLAYRVRHARERLLDYLDGKIPAVDELEETLLDPFGRGTDYKEEAVNFNLWKQNASANVI